MSKKAEPAASTQQQSSKYYENRNLVCQCHVCLVDVWWPSQAQMVTIYSPENYRLVKTTLLPNCKDYKFYNGKRDFALIIASSSHQTRSHHLRQYSLTAS